MALLRLLLLYAFVGVAIYAYIKRDQVMPMLGGAWHEIEETAEDLSREVGLSGSETVEKKAVKEEAEEKAEAKTEVAEATPAKAEAPEAAAAPQEQAAAPAPAPEQAPAADPAPTQPAAQPAPEAQSAPQVQPGTLPKGFPDMSMAYHPGASAPQPMSMEPPTRPERPARMEPPQRPAQHAMPENRRQGPISEADLAPDVRDAWIAARLAFYEGEYDKAEQMYVDLAANNPTLPDLMGELGNLYYYQQQHDKAAEAYLQAGLRAVNGGQLGLASSLVGALQRLAPDLADQLREAIQTHNR
ncbi:hypothetical protein JCM17960_17610 [Magnetospira thiophila]